MTCLEIITEQNVKYRSSKPVVVENIIFYNFAKIYHFRHCQRTGVPKGDRKEFSQVKARKISWSAIKI